ncbi:HD-GYP domain-containing protein [Maridesulfovibrio ferrireducens]|uniref:HD-GYP domain-containing protein n=1 Tax=Maridesulfovibrio ferrireducens TaxID=246191 RepID=UPI001A19E6CE|nr:HD-GYP domain-containing protein [Maridesulfovibrio ferrireducens]MBI9110701.1 HD-GYP domain-containing protein [Maridesulfovibrio ferrireducens]
MADNVKAIKKKDVKPGMYIRGYGKGSFLDPQVEVGRFIESFDDIAKYLPDDTEQVEILTDKILDIPDKKETKSKRTADAAAQDLAEALPAARKVHGEAMSYVKKMVSDIRDGKSVDIADVESIVDQIIENVSVNKSASMTLSFLKNYDEYTYTHCINVNLYSVLLGKDLGLDRAALQRLGVAALFHDVGKGQISNKVLNKPGKLTDEEYDIMKSHSLLGLKILRSVEGMRKDILRGVVEHHERFNGTGYPYSLAGDGIHPFGRMIAIADVYDALTSVRVYKKAMTASKTLSLMYKWKGTDFDPAYFNRFVMVMGIYPPGTFVQLEDKRFALVLETNDDAPQKPMVKVLFDKKMRPVVSECIDLNSYGMEGQGMKVLCQIDPSELGIDLKRLTGFLT